MRRLWLLLVVVIFFGARAVWHSEATVVIDSTVPIVPAAPAASSARTSLAPVASRRAETPLSSSFRCDGRTRCPQMTSCEEAKFFLAHCPNTKMDGDGDGIPCEGQFCG